MFWWVNGPDVEGGVHKSFKLLASWWWAQENWQDESGHVIHIIIIINVYWNADYRQYDFRLFQMKLDQVISLPMAPK